MSEDVELFVVISSSAFGLGIALAFACLFVWLRAAFSVSGVGELYRALTLGGAGAFAFRRRLSLGIVRLAVVVGRGLPIFSGGGSARGV